MQKNRSHIFYTVVVAIFLFLSCKNEHRETGSPFVFVPVDVSKIPFDTIDASNEHLSVINGICFFNNQAYSGFVKALYANGALKNIGSYYLGKQHGISKSFYENGQLRDERSFKDNVGYGRHLGYWENGNKKFNFFYINDKSEGLQQQWYPNGQAYMELNFKNDCEDGMQKAWRPNGKLFANYEVRDGIRYGLQKTNLCYTLKNQKIQ